MGKQDDRCEQAQCPTAERRYKRFFKGLGIIVSPDLRGSTQEKGRCCGIGLYLCVVLRDGAEGAGRTFWRSWGYGQRSSRLCCHSRKRVVRIIRKDYL